MSPWEIWISSQERMTLAVPEGSAQKLIDFLSRRGVEASVIGTYTDSGLAHITWHGELVMNLSMDFCMRPFPKRL